MTEPFPSSRDLPAERSCRWLFFLLPLLFLTACSIPPSIVKLPSPPEPRLIQTGIASWYGPGFHGKSTASGTIYDQNDLTAAHQTLPLGSRVMVTNLNNGNATESPYRIQTIPASLDYTLQLGSFSQRENAEQLRDRLAKSHADVTIVPLEAKDVTYYRVRLGTFTNRATAEEQARQLAQAGFPVIIMEK